jgi:hypothetical protein
MIISYVNVKERRERMMIWWINKMNWRGIWYNGGKEMKISLYMTNERRKSLLNFELDFHNDGLY